MKCIVYNNQEYINRKLSNEDVISAATIYGYSVLATGIVTGNFMVLSINSNKFSYYEYVVEQGKFYVKDYREDTVHYLTNILSSDLSHNLLTDQAVQRWWNCVFFEIDGIRTYDNSYNSLEISDRTNKTFEYLLENLLSSVSEMDLPISKEPLFLVGDLSEISVLQYALQKQYGYSKTTVLQPLNECETLNENSIVLLPTKRLNTLSLNTNVSIPLSSIITKSIDVTIPLDSSTEEIMLSDIKWKDILINEQNDYTAQGLGFKRIKLQISCDSYSNIFLNCNDLSGNHKVIQIS